MLTSSPETFCTIGTPKSSASTKPKLPDKGPANIFSVDKSKDDLVYDAIFNGDGRYGTSGTAFNSGLVEPTVNHGYRLHIVLRDGTEVMSIPGCCVQAHTVTTNVDGSADETLEFMTYITPSYGQTEDQAKLDPDEL